MVAKPTVSIEAYQRYLKGRALLYRRGKSTALALDQFQKAVELDPRYGPAWAGSADVYTMLGFFGVAHPNELRPRALEAASKAIALDPGSAEAHTARAMALLLWECDPVAAQQEFLKAIYLNPHYVQGRCWYALFYLSATGRRFEEGLAQARLALENDPLSSYVMGILAGCLSLMGRDDEAIAAARRSVEADPDSFFACAMLGSCLDGAGKSQEAVEIFQQACRMSSRATMAVSLLAVALGNANQREEARAAYQELLTRAASDYTAPSFLAPAALAAGDSEQAMRLAKRAWAERDPYFLFAARSHHHYHWFRAQPEFDQIIREMATVGT